MVGAEGCVEEEEVGVVEEGIYPNMVVTIECQFEKRSWTVST